MKYINGNTSKYLQIGNWSIIFGRLSDMKTLKFPFGIYINRNNKEVFRYIFKTQ